MWRLEVEAAAGADVQLHRVFKACASDVITTYGLGDSLDFLSMPDYGQAWFASTDFFFYLTHVFAVFPWFVQLVQFAPSWLVEGSVPSLRYLRMRQEVSSIIRCFPTGHGGVCGRHRPSSCA